MTIAEFFGLKPKMKPTPDLPEERATRRSLRVEEMDEGLVAALAAANVDDLDAEPKKLAD